VLDRLRTQHCVPVPNAGIEAEAGPLWPFTDARRFVSLILFSSLSEVTRVRNERREITAGFAVSRSWPFLLHPSGYTPHCLLKIDIMAGFHCAIRLRGRAGAGASG